MGLCFYANPSNGKMLALAYSEKRVRKISYFT